MKHTNKFVYALLAGCILLTACSNTNDSTTTDSTIQIQSESDNTQANDSSADENKNDENTVMGFIESINGSTLTLSSMGQGQKPEGDAPADMQKPDGDAPADMQKPDGDAPANMQKPDGDAPADMQKPDGGAPTDMQKPDGDAPQGEQITVTITDSTVITDESDNIITIDNLSQGNMVSIILDDSNNAISISISSPENMMMGMGGFGQNAPQSYTALNEYTTDTTISNESITSDGTDENAILVNGATVSLENITLDRTSADSTGGDNSSFYGIGASVLVTDGTLNISDSTITSDASGAAGVFAYGTGIANVTDTTITTMQDTSGGIHVAGGGTLHATNLTIETNGESAAAIRSDRGGGTMTVDGGSYISNGVGSPAVYCTADITITDADLTATNSEAVCIEGLNSLSLTDCNLSGAMQDLSQNDCTWNVILYQSMSGDSEIGNSTFSMTGGSLTAANGGMFYTTNTESTFYLSDVNITYAADNDFFLKCTGNSNQRGWGTSGANGADCSFTASSQDMLGNIIWDSISTLEFTMENASTLKGAFIQDETAALNGGSGYANLTIDSTSKWIVTADSMLSSLSCKGVIEDENGDSVTIKDYDGNILFEGNGSHIITVSSYTN